MALGSDLMSVARDGYALLEVAGKDAALKAARKELSARYARRRAVKEEAVGGSLIPAGPFNAPDP